MPAPESETLTLTVEGRVARISFDHPPVNIFDPEMQADLEAALDVIGGEESVGVIVFESGNPDFFIAHYDVEEILAEETGSIRTTTGSFNALMARIRGLPQVSIGKVRGAARGGGCEFLLALDMRFASRERARFAFPEAALGILAAGGGTQRLPATIGRARSLEMLLGCGDLSGELAETYGLVNRALPDSELDDYVDSLALRIASRPRDVIGMTKLAVSASSVESGEAGYAMEALLLDLLKSSPAGRERMSRFLEAGAQTEAGERQFEGLIERLDPE